jgi:hypothetical protein
MGTMLIGYDVEWRGEGDVTPRFLEQARSLHNRLGVPATLFVVGQTLERWLPEFQAMAGDPLFDIQQHTYSHQLLKTVYIEDGRSVRVVCGISTEETREEVRKTSALLAGHLPDILQVLREEGIRFTRTDGRNERDWHPVSMDLQPYWYDALGFPDVLEIPIHGWHDCVIRDEVLGWDDVDGYVESVRPYIDRAAAEDTVFSLCQHDWSSIRADPQMRATEALIHYAQERGLRFMSYRAYYNECKDRRGKSAKSPEAASLQPMESAL